MSPASVRSRFSSMEKLGTTEVVTKDPSWFIILDYVKFGNLCFYVLQGCHWLRKANQIFEQKPNVDINIIWRSVSQRWVDTPRKWYIYKNMFETNHPKVKQKGTNPCKFLRAHVINEAWNKSNPGLAVRSLQVSEHPKKPTCVSFSLLWKNSTLQYHGSSHTCPMSMSMKCLWSAKFSTTPSWTPWPRHYLLSLRRHKRHHLHCGLGGHRPANVWWNCWCWDDPTDAIVLIGSV